MAVASNEITKQTLLETVLSQQSIFMKQKQKGDLGILAALYVWQFNNFENYDYMVVGQWAVDEIGV